MTTRTVQFIGKAYNTTGTLDVSLWVNNVELFNGTVAASTDPVPSKLPRRDAGVVFTFDLSTDIVGTVPLLVTIEGGPLAFYNLQSNYTGLDRSPTDPTVVTVNPVDYYSDLCIRNTEHDGRYDVEIGGIPKTRWDEDNVVEGGILPDWCWWIPTDSYMSCNIDIAHPVVDIPPAFTTWDAAITYPTKSLIRIEKTGYQALKTVPAGTPLTNAEFWQKADDSF